MYVGGDTKFQLEDTKLYVPVVTLSAKDNTNFIKQQNEDFKRSAYWNEYKSDVSTQTADLINAKRFQLDPSFQGVNRLFVLAFNVEGNDNRVTRDGHQKYFLPRVDIKGYNFAIDGRNFYDNPISSQIGKYNELRKVTLGKADDYTTGCLLDYQYFKKHYQLLAVDLSKQKELDADPIAIQQIEFYGNLETNAQVCTVLEKSKETILEFYKGIVKVY